ncbi:MAG: MBL fold metallo-hydrolase [Thermoleophilia bacterium]|nr:MBL fold metallo-hydrolase [Thermoleophilia bacterium]
MYPSNNADDHRSFESDAQSWYYTRNVAPGVWLIAEPQHVYSWLVEGSDRAVLLDTGMGVVPIRPVAESLTDRPISVVNTHYHFDHIGGNWEFDDVAIHEIGAPLIEEAIPRELFDAYLGYARKQLDAAETARALDHEFLWILGTESDPRPFPSGWDEASWDLRPTRATQLLKDGDAIDLGDRTLKVIHAPGHSPDGICLLEEKTGLLFAGDSSNAGPIYTHFPDSDLDQLVRTAHRLADLGEAVKVAFFCHYGRPVAEPDFFAEVAAGLDRLAAKEVDTTPAVDIIGTPVLEARFDHFWVTVPDPDAEAAVLTESTE